MVMLIERGQNTHGKGERVKIPLLPNNVSKRSVYDSGQGHNTSEAERANFVLLVGVRQGVNLT